MNSNELLPGQKIVAEAEYKPSASARVIPLAALFENQQIVRKLQEQPSTENVSWLNENRYWIEHLAAYENAVVDKRLAKPIGKENPDGLPRPTEDAIIELAFLGESTSWNFIDRPSAITRWRDYRQVLASAVEMNNAEEMVLSLRALEARNQKEFREKITQFATSLHTDGLISDEIMNSLDKSLVIFGSGADALLGAQDLLAPGKKCVTTGENGSKLVEEYKQNKFTEITLRNPDNQPKTARELEKEWDAAIAKGDRFLSVTQEPKSSLRYDQIVNNLANKVAKHNRENPDDPIIMVVDAVQILGRTHTRHVFKWLNMEGVAAVVHTGSKAPGGMPHAGFLWLSAEGRARMQKVNSTRSQEEIQAIFAKREVGFANISSLEGQLPADNFLTQVRGIDNMEAIMEMRNQIEFGDTNLWDTDLALQLRRMNESVFKACGFYILDCEIDESGKPIYKNNNTFEVSPSIISMELPQSVDIGAAIVAIQTLALQREYPVTFGGVMKSQRPIFRFGIRHQDLVALYSGALTLQQYQEKLHTMQVKLQEAGLRK